MNHNGFQKVLDKTEKKIKELQKQCDAVKYLFMCNRFDDAYESSLTLEEICEKTVLLTRALPTYSGKPHAKADVDDTIRLNVPISIGFTSRNWFSVRIPALLPKKEDGSADYIRSSLYLAMKDFFNNAEPVRYDDCVLIYRHIYQRDRPERKKRDHDNIEINMVSDIVAMYVMADDGPSTCSHYYCSNEGSEERTEIYVVPKREFSVFVMKEKYMPDEGVKLNEKRVLQRKKDM